MLPRTRVISRRDRIIFQFFFKNSRFGPHEEQNIEENFSEGTFFLNVGYQAQTEMKEIRGIISRCNLDRMRFMQKPLFVDPEPIPGFITFMDAAYCFVEFVFLFLEQRSWKEEEAGEVFPGEGTYELVSSKDLEMGFLEMQFLVFAA